MGEGQKPTETGGAGGAGADRFDPHDPLRAFIAQLGTVPAGSRLIDQTFVEQCKAFTDGDPVRFLRDLRDELVYSSGCTDGVIMMIGGMLSLEREETREERDARHAELSARLGVRL